MSEGTNAQEQKTSARKEPNPRLMDLLHKAREKNASDLQLSVMTKPRIRVKGELIPIEDEPVLTPHDTEEMVLSIIPDDDKKVLYEEGQADFAFSVRGEGRYRVNAYRQRSTFCAALRLMSQTIQDPDRIGIPKTVMELANEESGLCLVTGPTGCGKSTTLAAIIQRINEQKYYHIITLEDPIEYLYRHDKSIVDQREIGTDAKDFPMALRAALREDPDVILVGEMRDLDTISTAITAAETGHLVFSTLHTNSAASTIDRIIDVFPSGQQAQIRIQLSMVLKAVISQRLVVAADGAGSSDRVPIFEVMHVTPAISNYIRTNKTNQIQGVLAQGRSDNNNTLDQALADACARGKIDLIAAKAEAEDPDTIEKKVNEARQRLR